MRRIAIVCFCLAVAGTIWVAKSDSLSGALWRQFQRGPGAEISFASLAPYEWDRVFIFGPYTPHKDIHNSLGFHWAGVSRTNIGDHDGITLVVFVRGNEVVEWFEHPRNRGDLAKLPNGKGYAQGRAKFEVKSEADGRLVADPRELFGLPDTEADHFGPARAEHWGKARSASDYLMGELLIRSVRLGMGPTGVGKMFGDPTTWSRWRLGAAEWHYVDLGVMVYFPPNYFPVPRGTMAIPVDQSAIQ